MRLNPSYVGEGYTINVAPPWYIAMPGTGSFCPAETPAPAGCIEFTDGSVPHNIYFVTDDPNAPGRNATIRSINAGECP